MCCVDVQEGQTPLFFAADRNLAMVDLLLARGADMDMADKVRHGSSCVQGASRQ